jgi:tetratricopeptide (TPR) repeat protein
MRTLPILLLILLPFLVFGQNKKQRKLYHGYIASADSAFKVKNYPFAKTKYKKAVEIKPAEAYPAERITLCDKMIIEQGVEYKKWILRADSCFAIEDWTNAKTYYLKAVDAKPFEQYANDQAKNCNYHILSAVAINDLYEEQLQRADSCFIAKSWSCAKANYEAASRTKPDQQYPKDRIAECEKKIVPIVKEERYQILVGDADAQFAGGNYQRAKQIYEEALLLKPGAAYATSQIARCNEMINAPK